MYVSFETNLSTHWRIVRHSELHKKAHLLEDVLVGEEREFKAGIEEEEEEYSEVALIDGDEEALTEAVEEGED